MPAKNRSRPIAETPIKSTRPKTAAGLRKRGSGCRKCGCTASQYLTVGSAIGFSVADEIEKLGWLKQAGLISDA